MEVNWCDWPKEAECQDNQEENQAPEWDINIFTEPLHGSEW